MNFALPSASEPLVLDFLSYRIVEAVNSLWAWVAVITAAVSYWRFRAISPPEPRLHKWAAAEPINLEEEKEQRSLPNPKPTPVLDGQGSTKIKFTAAYYHDEDNDFEEKGEDVDEDYEENKEETGIVQICDWEKMALMKMKIN